MAMKSSALSCPLSTRALLLLVSSTAWRGVGGLATKLTMYYDEACEVDSGYFTLTFGTPVEYNECKTISDYSSQISVCDATTGETSVQYFADGTCSELDPDEVDTSSCELYDTTSGQDCSENGGVCSFMRECTNDIPSAIDPTVINYLANEYNDAACTDPTGNSVTISGQGALFGAHNGDCVMYDFWDRHSISECRADGSTVSQCLTSCTTDATTVWFDTPAPTFAPAEVTRGSVSNTPAATTILYGDGDAGTPVPAVFGDGGAAADTFSPVSAVDDDSAANTPGPTTDDIYGSAADTSPPATDFDDDTTADPPGPTVFDDDGDVTAHTSAPGVPEARGIGVTLTTVQAPEGDNVREPTTPATIDEGTLASGGVQRRSGAAVGSFVLSIVVGAFVGLAE